MSFSNIYVHTSNIYVHTCVQQQTTYITQRFHLLIFPCLLKWMELALTMKTQNNFKQEKMLKMLKNSREYQRF